jgi:hypothetical protein
VTRTLLPSNLIVCPSSGANLAAQTLVERGIRMRSDTGCMMAQTSFV